MARNTTAKIAKLLSQAGAAHHDYEQRVLSGVYDEEWPTWYAKYIIEHGLQNLAGGNMSIDQLGRILREVNETYQKDKTEQNWADYAAARIFSRL